MAMDVRQMTGGLLRKGMDVSTDELDYSNSGKVNVAKSDNRELVCHIELSATNFSTWQVPVRVR